MIDSKGLYLLRDGDFVTFEIPSDGKHMLCGVPGAYTPGCTKRHLPGFRDNVDKFKELGFDSVMFTSVNDPCVMQAWVDQHGSDDIIAVADPSAIFAKHIGKDVDYGESMGIRSKRYAVVIENGEIVKEFSDPFVEGVLSELDK